jgi:uncharacterized peroxidase-related enzyme
MKTFEVPKREEVSENNKVIFDNLEKAIGFVPNLFATYAYSEHALANYLALSNAKTSLSSKEKEAVNLVVSQVNNCVYCLAAHTAIGKMNGFSDNEILELRSGHASFDPKLDALVKLAKNITENRGATSDEIADNFLSKGWSKENLIDTIVLVGDKTISNYLHKTTQVPVDFPEAQALELTEV